MTKPVFDLDAAQNLDNNDPVGVVIIRIRGLDELPPEGISVSPTGEAEQPVVCDDCVIDLFEEFLDKVEGCDINTLRAVLITGLSEVNTTDAETNEAASDVIGFAKTHAGVTRATVETLLAVSEKDFLEAAREKLSL